MTTTYKVLGQVNPSATTLTTLYTVPGSTQTVCSSITACNQGTSTNVRIAVRPTGTAIDPKHYIVYDTVVASNDTMIFTIGITLGTTDVVSVYAGTANVSFNLFGSEIS